MVFTLGSGLHLGAILVSGALSLLIGFLWYGPLFRKPWAAYTGWTDEKVRSVPGGAMALTYLLTLLAALVQAVVLSLLSRSLGATLWGEGLVLGLLAGGGFVTLGFATTYLFEHKPLGLWLIVSGYEVAYLAVAGVLVTVWR